MRNITRTNDKHIQYMKQTTILTIQP